MPKRPKSSFPRTRESSLRNDNAVEIIPLRVVFLNEVHFPRSQPLLEAFFPCHGALGILVNFKIDESFHMIPLGEAVHLVVLMLPHHLDKIGSHPDIQGAVASTGKDVDIEVLGHRHVSRIPVFTGMTEGVSLS